MKICFVSTDLDAFKGGGRYIFSILPKLSKDFKITLAAAKTNAERNKNFRYWQKVSATNKGVEKMENFSLKNTYNGFKKLYLNILNES